MKVEVIEKWTRILGDTFTGIVEVELTEKEIHEILKKGKELEKLKKEAATKFVEHWL